MKRHNYTTTIEWTGNDGPGTQDYRSYRRDHTIYSPGKEPISASSDPVFRGDPGRYNPEELLVASLSSCHMLWYLHLCSANGVTVHSYVDTPVGVMEESGDGSGAFVHVLLKPLVTINLGDNNARALALHTDAHHLCFIARSVNFPVETAAEIVFRER